MKCMSALAFACVAVVVTIPARAEVTQIEISSRTDVLGGRSYGVVGPYEWLEGRAHFALDPAHPRNRTVVDLGLAPRNSRGLVEFSADIAIMRPKDSARASGVTVFDVVNRGRPTILDFLDRGNFLAKPGTPEYIGDDFLLKQGTTLVWLGWQHDLTFGGNARLHECKISSYTGRSQGQYPFIRKPPSCKRSRGHCSHLRGHYLTGGGPTMASSCQGTPTGTASIIDGTPTISFT